MTASKPTATNYDVIRGSEVRLVGQAAMLDCGTITDGRPGLPLGIVPLMDGDRVAGFEVRCGCGASALVECVYEDATRSTPGPLQPTPSQSTASDPIDPPTPGGQEPPATPPSEAS